MIQSPQRRMAYEQTSMWTPTRSLSYPSTTLAYPISTRAFVGYDYNVFTTTIADVSTTVTTVTTITTSTWTSLAPVATSSVAVVVAGGGETVSQAAIIVLAVICGLLLLAVLFALLIIFARRIHSEQPLAGTETGGGAGARHRRRRHASDKMYTEDSSKGNDDFRHLTPRELAMLGLGSGGRGGGYPGGGPPGQSFGQFGPGPVAGPFPGQPSPEIRQGGGPELDKDVESSAREPSDTSTSRAGGSWRPSKSSGSEPRGRVRQ